MREVDARDDVLRAERHLLGLGEEVVDHPVQHEAADRPDRKDLLGDELGGVEHVERRTSRRRRRRTPARRAPTPGSRPLVIASHRSRRWKSGSAPLIFTASSHSTDCMPCFGFQWNFTNVDSPAAFDEPERVDAEALHEPERPGDRPVRHHPHQHVRRLRHQRHEVPEVVVRRLRLREPPIRFRLHGVDRRPGT